MPAGLTTTLASAAIVLGAILGAAIPVYSGPKRLVTFLAFAAGVMFGAAFFHMLPEAAHSGGYSTLSWVPAGFLLMFLLERYVLVHVCEEPPDCAEHSHGRTIGMAAFIGLAAHTLFDGVALGSASEEGVGLTAFVAIASHKVPSSLSLASILIHEGRSRRTVFGLAAVYGLMVPLGAVLYFGLSSVIPMAGFAPAALAFSAGTFLYIAVSDLLPNVNRHGGNGGRLGNILSLAAGLLVMLLLTLVTGDHGHGGAPPH